jgi:hypothetical protein
VPNSQVAVPLTVNRWQRCLKPLHRVYFHHIAYQSIHVDVIRQVRQRRGDLGSQRGPQVRRPSERSAARAAWRARRRCRGRRAARRNRTFSSITRNG